MSTAKVKLGIAFDGEKEVKTAITNINAQLRTLQSEAEKVKSSFAGQEKSEASLNAQCKVLSETITAQKSKISTLQEAVAKAKENESQWAQQVQKTGSQLEQARAELDRMKSSTDATTEEIEQQEKAVAELEQQLSKEEQSLTKSNTNTEKWQNTLNKAETDLNNTTRQLNETEQELDDYASGADKAADETKDLSENADGASSKISSLSVAFGQMIANLATQALQNATQALKEFASSTIEIGTTFESSMSKVEALSGATSDEMETLSEVAREAGKTTVYSASEAADALGYMALAGWDTAEMAEGLDPILNLAASASMDLAEASDIVTDYLTAFGLSAEDAGHFTDVMSYAMANSNTDVTQLGESYKNVAATASSMGYSVEDTTAALMTMANAGVKGGEAGTALNTIMTRLATDTKGCASALAEYGVEIYDANGNINSLSSILIGMSDIWDQLTDAEQASLAKTIAGTNQYSSLQTIMSGLSDAAKESGTSFTDYTSALETCDGAAKEMSETMQDNLSGDLKTLNSVWEDFQLTLYETESGAMRGIVQTVSGELIPALNDLVTGTEGASEKMATALTDITKQFGGIAGDIIGALFGEEAGAAISELVDALADAMGEIMSVIQSISSAIGAVITIGAQLISAVMEPVKSVLNGLAPIINDVANICLKLAQSILPGLSAAWNLVASALEPVFDILGLLFDGLSLVADGVSWLVSGLGWLLSGCPKVAEGLEEATAAMQNTNETLQDFNDSWSDFVSTQDEALNSTLTEASHIEALAKELDGLVDANGNVKAGYESRVNYIVGELSDATGQEITIVDGAIQKYGELKESIEDAMQTQRVEAMMTYYTNIISQYEEQLPTLQASLSEVNDGLATLKDRMDASTEGTDEYTAAQEAYTQALEEKQLIESQIATYTQANIEYDQLYTATLENDTETIKALSNSRMETVEKDGATVMKTNEEKLADYQAYNQALESLLADANAKQDTAAAQMYQSQIQANNEKIEAARAGVEAETAAMLSAQQEQRSELTSAIAQQVETRKQGMQDEVKAVSNAKSALVSATKENSSAVNNAASSLGSTLNSTFNTAGNQAGRGLSSGLDAQFPGIKEKISSWGSTMSSILQSALKIASPSKVFRQIGVYTGQGLEIGLTDSFKDAQKSLSKSVDSLITTANAGLSGISIPGFKAESNTTYTSNNADVVVAINALGGAMLDAVKKSGATYNIDGITYDSGSAITGAVEELVRAVTVERRA